MNFRCVKTVFSLLFICLGFFINSYVTNAEAQIGGTAVFSGNGVIGTGEFSLSSGRYIYAITKTNYTSGGYIEIKRNGIIYTISSTESFYNSYLQKTYFKFWAEPGHYTIRVYGGGYYGGPGGGGYGFASIEFTYITSSTGTLLRILKNSNPYYSNPATFDLRIRTKVNFSWSGGIEAINPGGYSAYMGISGPQTSISEGYTGSSGSFIGPAGQYSVVACGGWMQPLGGDIYGEGLVYIWFDDSPLTDTINLTIDNSNAKPDGTIWTFESVTFNWINNATGSRWYKVYDNLSQNKEKASNITENSVQLSNLGPGEHDIYVIAYDEYDNPSPASNNYRFFIDNTAPTGNIKINNSVATTTYTNNPDLTVYLNSVFDPESGLYRVCFSEDGGKTYSSWKQIPTSGDKDKAVTYSLTSTTNGLKTIYAKVMNYAGKTTVFTDSITLDTVAPINCTATINDSTMGLNIVSKDEKTYISYKDLDAPKPVIINLSATDSTSGVSNVVLQKGDIKYKEFNYTSGNAHETDTQNIPLEGSQTSPVLVWYEIKIEGLGAYWGCESPIVTIINCTPTVVGKYSNTVSGYFMIPANQQANLDVDTGHAWNIFQNINWGAKISIKLQCYFDCQTISFSNLTPWDQTQADGEKKAGIFFTDNAGNYTDPIPVSVILDNTAPTGRISSVTGDSTYVQINYDQNGKETGRTYYTKDSDVTLNLSVDDGSGVGVDKIYLGATSPTLSSEWNPWDSANSSITHSLDAHGEDGPRAIYFGIRDFLGHATVINPSIMLDRQAPAGSLTLLDENDNPQTGNHVKSLNIRLRIHAADNLGPNNSNSGVKTVKLWNADTPGDVRTITVTGADTDIDWTLSGSLGTGPVNNETRKICMKIEDNVGNIKIYDVNNPDGDNAFKVCLDTTIPNTPVEFGHTFETGGQLKFEWELSNPENDIDHFEGAITLPGGTKSTFTALPIESETDRYTGNTTTSITGIGPNKPVEIEVYSVDHAGNRSLHAGTHTAYTKAVIEAGDLAELPNEGHSPIQWQLTPNSKNGTGVTYQLEYWLPGNTDPEETRLEPNEDNIFTLEAADLSGHPVYRYRLVAINGSGDETKGIDGQGRVITYSPFNIKPGLPELLGPIGYGALIVNGNGPQLTFRFKCYQDADNDDVDYYIHYYPEDHPEEKVIAGPITSDIEGTQTLAASDLVDGIKYNWYIVVQDTYMESGKKVYSTQTTAEKQFTIDNTQPDIEAIPPAAVYSTATELSFSINAIPSGIKSVSYEMLDNNETIIGTGTIPEASLTKDPETGKYSGTITLIEGRYNLHISVQTKAGLSAAETVSGLIIDHTAPVLKDIQLQLPQSGNCYLLKETSARVQWRAEDTTSNMKEIKYWLEDTQGKPVIPEKRLGVSPNQSSYSYPFTFGEAADGVYNLFMTATDRAGNQSGEYQCPIPIRINRHAPEINLTVQGFQEYGSNLYISSLEKLSVSYTVNPQTAVEFAVTDINGAAVTAWGTWEQVQKAGNLQPGVKYQITCRAQNETGLEIKVHSRPFTYDNSAPFGLDITGPAQPIGSGEQACFTISAQEPDSAITGYRLAIGSTKGASDLTGWLTIQPGTTQVRIDLPAEANGVYYPTLEATNAAGLTATHKVETGFSVSNIPERLIVKDQGPYTMYDNRLAVALEYRGAQTVTRYDYRIVNDAGTVIYQETIATDQKTTEITVGDSTEKPLKLTNGQTYRFEVTAILANGNISGSSPGVKVDTGKPLITQLETPVYATTKNIRIQWTGTDSESRIAQAQVALGSDYYKTDVTGVAGDYNSGWVQLAGNPATLSCKADGSPLTLNSGGRYYLTLRLIDAAGNISEQIAPAIIIDDTPPPVPAITDQGSYLNPLQPLEANWVWTPMDSDSGTTYQWAIVESPDQINAASWNNTGEGELQIKLAPGDIRRQNMAEGITYYIAVKATNGAGLTSIGYSDGIVLDAQAPIIPGVTIRQATQGGYINQTNNLQLDIDSYDLISGIDHYLYHYGAPETVDQTGGTQTQTATVNLRSTELVSNGVTVYKAEVYDKTGLASQAGYSAGIKYDPSDPKVVNVRAGLSAIPMVHQPGQYNNLIYFDWETTNSNSPVIQYKAVLVPAGVRVVPESDWQDLKADRCYSIDAAASNLPDGRYELLIKARNSAGTWSSQGNWGISPVITLDRTAPLLKAEQFECPQFAAANIQVHAEADDPQSGIGAYQYTCGSFTNPSQYSGGWIDVSPNELSGADIEIATTNIPQGTKVYISIRAKDRAGLWSDTITSSAILIDHSPPTSPEISCPEYSTSASVISNITYSVNSSRDDESGLTKFRLSVVKNPGETWIAVCEGLMPQDATGEQLALTLDLSEIIPAVTLNEGAYYLGMQTKNGAGEWSKTGYSSLFTVDTIPPELTFEEAGKTIVVNNPPLTVEYTLTEPATVKFRLVSKTVDQTFEGQGQAGTNYLILDAADWAKYHLKPESYQLDAQPVDKANHMGVKKPQSIRVNAPPVISMTDSYQTTPNQPLAITATVTDADSVAGDVINYQMDPGDGTGIISGTATIEEYTENNVTKTYCRINATHRYTQISAEDPRIILTVIDKDDGTSISDETHVKVGNTQSGTLYMDETWSGIHKLNGTVTVLSGIHLTIEPGAQVIVDGLPGSDGYDIGLIIQGSLTVGTGASFEAQGAGLLADGTIRNRWNGILVEGTATLDGATISHAHRGITVMNQAAVTITNCTFMENYVGVHVYGSTPVIQNSSFTNNQWYGIKEDQDGEPIIINCSFSGNEVDDYRQDVLDANE